MNGSRQIDPTPPRPARCLQRLGRVAVVLLALFAVQPDVRAQSSASRNSLDNLPWQLIDIHTDSNLEFGAVMQHAGQVSKTLTDPYLAKFKVTVTVPWVFAHLRRANIRLYPPTNLLGPGSAAVPFAYRAAYNSYADDPASAVEMEGSTATIDLKIPDGQGFLGVTAYSAYVYVYGDVDVDGQTAGFYTSDVNLTAELALSGGPWDKDDDDHDEDDEDCWDERRWEDDCGDDDEGDDRHADDRHDNDRGKGHDDHGKGKGKGHHKDPDDAGEDD